MQLTEKDERRFWSKTDSTGAQGCLLWIGARTERGYGQFVVNYKTMYAHRISYALRYGNLPKGLDIRQKCGKASCVNPDHLVAQPRKETVRAGNSVSGVHARKTHCPQGHEYTEENTHIRRNGSRQCRTCNRERARSRRTRKEK